MAATASLRLLQEPDTIIQFLSLSCLPPTVTPQATYERCLPLLESTFFGDDLLVKLLVHDISNGDLQMQRRTIVQYDEILIFMSKACFSLNKSLDNWVSNKAPSY